MFVVKTLNIITKKRLSRALMMLMFTNTFKKMYEIQYFINSEIKRNFMS